MVYLYTSMEGEGRVVDPPPPPPEKESIVIPYLRTMRCGCCWYHPLSVSLPDLPRSVVRPYHRDRDEYMGNTREKCMESK